MPVIASVSASKTGGLFNVNADTLAANVAARLSAPAAGHRRRHRRACSTRDGATLPLVDAAATRRMVKAGTASAGMVAKLAACRAAATRGVSDVRIADGRVPATLLAALLGEATGAWTRVK